ncbi:DUF4249 family protein [Runella zeae]|uniref:DUF4249 family protein n=1 Tax=Runella zeae TaxID=94255 RepID=UPI00042888FF|nr:DUF4249 family protein [Runella zeae]
MKKIISIASVLVLTLTACQKEIDLDLENKSGQITIEGNLSDQVEPHFVKITKSVAFTQANQYPQVSNAVVTISDNFGLVDTLKYESEGKYKTSKLKAGVSGRTYTLKVLLEGQTYTSQCEMPEKVHLNGLKLNVMSFFGNTSYDVLPEYIDPPRLGNVYVFFVKVNSQKGTVFETFTDNFGNGVANQRDLNIPNDTDNPVKAGDIVSVEMRSVDSRIYTYFNALNQLAGGGPGGGISPANPPSNISGGALGYFSVHTSEVRSITIK